MTVSSTKSKQMFVGVLFAALVMIGLYGIFAWAKKERKQRDHSVAQVARLLAQRETGFFDSFATGTKFEDLERFGLTACTEFGRVSNPPMTLINLTEKAGCKQELWVHKSKSLKLTSRSGERWVYTYVPATGRDFIFQWAMASVACLVIAGLLFAIWRIGQQSIQVVLENRRKLHRQVAHDSKSPLLALKEMAKGQGNVEPKVVKVLYQCIVSLEGMIDSLNEERVAGKTPHALAPLLEQVVEEKRVEYAGRSLQIELNVQGQGSACVDPVGLKRLVSNAINNSFEAGSQIRVTITLSESTDQVSLVIRDNGKGISEDVLKKFRKARVSTKGESRGFGLTGALEFCEQYGGTLDIKPIAPHGTELQIRLPRIEAARPDLTKVKRMLLLDDDNLVAAVWKAKARERAIPFERFASYEAFQAAGLRPEEGDEVFVDYELGDDRGSRLIPLLRQQGWSRIWLATAHEGDELKDVVDVLGILSKEFPG